MSPFTGQLKTVLQELFKFRGRGVHPSSTFKDVNYRPDIDSGVHPHFITFSGAHAVQARALTLVMLERLVEQAREILPTGADTGWLDSGQEVLNRLSATYRVPGDDKVAYPTSDPDPA